MSNENCECELNLCDCELEQCECKYNIDYYDILSLNQDCHFLDIRKAFKDFLIEYDIENCEDKLPQEFHAVAEAYEILVNPKTRLIYDNFGAKGLLKGISEPYGWAKPFVYHGDPIKTLRKFINYNLCTELCNLEDTSLLILKQKPQAKLCKGENITKTLFLTLEEIFFGGLKKIVIKKRVLKDHSDEVVEVEKVLKIPISPGTPEGTKFIFANEGDEAPSTIPGDIIFTTEDRPHEIFQRDGANLLMMVNVTLQDALFGTTITINSIDGRIIRLNITSIITSNYQKIVPGEGLPLVENSRERGDLTISFTIQFPLYLNISNKNDIKRAFSDVSKYIAKSDNDNE